MIAPSGIHQHHKRQCIEKPTPMSISHSHAASWCIRSTQKIAVADELTKKTENVELQSRKPNGIGGSIALSVSNTTLV